MISMEDRYVKEMASREQQQREEFEKQVNLEK